MPPSMSAAKAAKDAPQQEGLDPNSCEVALNEGSRDNEKGTGVSAGPGVKSKEKGGSRRKQPKSNKGSASSTSTSTITDDTTKPSGAEPDDANDARAPSRLSDAESVATEPLPQFHFGRTLPQLPTAPFSKVPVLAHCELRELHSASDNNDDNDQGLFATQKLEQGTRIISERPFLTLTAPGDQLDELMLAYESLTKADQEQIWNLRPAAPEASEQLANLRFLTDRLAYDLQNIIFKPTVTRTTVEQGILDEMLPKLQNAMNIWRVAARWHANRCSMTDLPMDQRSSLSQGTPITGLFIKRAHIRHSCVPNCFASFDANVGRMNVHVTRNIAAGEELTLSAFADNMYYSIAADREQELSAWGLTCNCEACDRQHPAFKTHEKSRQRAHTRAVLLSDVLTRLESEELAEVRPLLPAPSYLYH